MANTLKGTLTARKQTGALAGLVLIFGSSLWVLLRGSDDWLTVAHLWTSDALKWLKVTLLLSITLYWERERLSSLGLQAPTWQDAALIPAVAVAVLMAQQFIGASLVQALGMRVDLSALHFLQELPVYQKISVVLTAGITEEVMYRGYAIERIEKLTGSTTLSVLLTTGLFVGVHVPVWGLATAIHQTLTTLVLAVAYVWRRNLTAPIGGHIIIDSLGVFLAAG